MKVFLFVALTILSGHLNAAEWLSPVDLKYKNKAPALFAKFDDARNMIDAWRGEREKLKNAYRLLSEVIESDREYAPAYRELGRLYIAAGYINTDRFEPGSLPPSEAAILKSIQIEPEYADAYVLLGHLYTNMKRYVEAKSALQKADEIGTKTPWLGLNWAALLMRLGQEDAAFDRYRAVIETGTENRKAYGSAIEGGITYYRRKGQYAMADEWYKKQLTYEPENAWAWGNYASFLLFSRADVDGAIKNAEKALSIMDYGMGRFTLACAQYTKWALMTKGKEDKVIAQSIFDKAYEAYPDIDSIIAKTEQYPYTKVTAILLAKYKGELGHALDHRYK